MTTKIKTQSEELKELVSKTNLKHIAIIMDGNRRWAKEKHLPTAAGHSEGFCADIPGRMQYRSPFEQFLQRCCA